MKYCHILTFSIVLTLCSCDKKQEVKNIEAPVLSIKTEDKTIITDQAILKDVRYIKLETKEDCLLEDIHKVIYHNNKLYILSSVGKGNVFIFDNNGKFIDKIKKGEGPEEIIYPTDITISSINNRLVILDFYRNIKEYDLNGKFIHKISLKDPFLSLESLDEDYLLFDPNSRSKSNYYVQYITQTLETKDFFKKPVKGTLFSVSNFFTKTKNDEVIISCIFSDTIFHINNKKEFLPYLILDFHNKAANNPKRLNEINSLGEYLANAEDKNYITGPSDLSIINDNIFFTLNGKEYYYAKYDTNKKSISLHKNLIEGLPNIYKSVGRTDREIIYSMDSPWLIEFINENPQINSNIIKQLKQEFNNENDNPILLFGSF